MSTRWLTSHLAKMLLTFIQFCPKGSNSSENQPRIIFSALNECPIWGESLRFCGGIDERPQSVVVKELLFLRAPQAKGRGQFPP